MEYPLTFDKYQKALEQGRFLGLRCGSCGNITFPPKGLCRVCGSRDLAAADLKGRGVIRTFTVVRVAPEGFNPPYIVAMVELEEGPFVIGNLEGVSPDEASMDLMGKPVSLGSRLNAGRTCSPGDCRVLSFQLAGR
jgi:hypothetical protein